MGMLTATYKLSKYSAKILAPLWKSKHSLRSSKDFMNKTKTKEIPTGYHGFIWHQVLFNNVPFDRKNDIILQRTYNREIQTTMSKKELKKLLILCKKNVHFTFGGKTLVQSYGLAMGSPLGPVLGDTFMLC